MDKTFTQQVKRYKRKPDTFDKEVDGAGAPIVERDIGEFEFRVPNVADNFDISAKRQQLLAKVGDMAFVTPDLMLMAEVQATIPRQVAKAPDGWNWQEIYDEITMLEIYQAYAEGLGALRKKNTDHL